jgi:sugar lactone lactonase YvrE
MGNNRSIKPFFNNLVCDIVHKPSNCFGLFILIMAAQLIFATPFLMAQELISVPSNYVRELKLPGASNNFLRPARILADNELNEIYVADAGNDRIVIFDQNGLYKFEFSTAEQCGAPIDIAVDSTGHIFILGATGMGPGVFEYDYNGLFLRQFLTDSLIAQTQISSMAFDSYDKLYLVDSKEKRILRLTHDGAIDKEFPASPDLTDNLLRDASYGIIAITDNTIYLPISSIGTVYCFDLDGNLEKTIGYLGTQVGELNFPVATAVTADKTVLVLDKHRFDVACFTNDGKFLGEFGGKGISPGWFYHPNWLAIDSNGLIYIGQIFNNKIQICRMPAPILERQQKITDGKTIQEKSLNGSGDQTGQMLNKRSPAKGLVILNINQHNGGIPHA